MNGEILWNYRKCQGAVGGGHGEVGAKDLLARAILGGVFGAELGDPVKMGREGKVCIYSCVFFSCYC